MVLETCPFHGEAVWETGKEPGLEIRSPYPDLLCDLGKDPSLHWAWPLPCKLKGVQLFVI